MTKDAPSRSRLLLALTSLLTMLLPVTAAFAFGTTLWQIDTADQLDDGELDHVTLSSLGEVKLGRSTTRVELEDVAAVWSVARADDGTPYLGTGNSGQILRLRRGAVEKVADTDSLVVASLAFGDGSTLYAGTVPGGKIYSLDVSEDEPEAEVLVELDDAEHVWALMWDTKRRVLYAGTGPEGVVYAVQPSGRAEVYYDTDDDHALSLALPEPGGALLVGTSPKARLLRVTGPGRAEGLHDFDATEVKGIADRGEDGVYLVVNEFPEPPSLPKTTSARRSKSKSRRSRPKPGKGKIFRRLPDGSVEPLLEFDDGHLTSVEALDDGLVYAGTGAKGRVLAVGDDRVGYTIADIDERQVLALSLAGDEPLFVSGDVGAVYRVGKAAASLAEYRTAPIDARFLSTWGRIEWSAEGKLLIQTRSGNTEEPDPTWSDWSAPVARSGAMSASPAARYLQVRARWSRDPDAVLRGLSVYHLPNNQRPVITEVEVDSQYLLARPEVASKATAATVKRSKSSKSKRDRDDERSTELEISWDVDNPDHDRLRFRLFFRGEGEPAWQPILPSDEVLTKESYDWETAAVPAGRYLIKVEASDELDNPAERARRHQKITPPVVIDNQPPLLRKIASKARRITGRAVDGFSPIALVEYSLDGRLWNPVGPADAMFDSPSEPFAFEVPPDVSTGAHTLAIRAYDRALNMAIERVIVTIP